jgi:LysM repeat protein
MNARSGFSDDTDPGLDRRRRPTGLVVGVLVVFLAGVVVAVFVTLGGGSDEETRATAKTTSTSPGSTTTTRGEEKYTVKAGDVLSSIAKKFDVAAAVIVERNQLADPDHLVAGQVLVIPPPTPVRLIVKPKKVEVGESVDITLKGAQPNELIVFEIYRPAGKFTGQTHTAFEDGEVSTTYQLGKADTPGEYIVVAKGDQITKASATFHVVAAKSTTSTT